MINSVVLSIVKIPREDIVAIIMNESSPSKAAACCEEELRRFFRLAGNELPVFRLISLGIGADGHTASLSPGTHGSQSPEVLEKMRLAIAVEHDYVMYAGISLTLPVMNNAAKVIFVVTGKSKAAVVKRVIRQRDLGLSAARVEPPDGTLLFLADSEAALLMSKKYNVQI